MEVEIYIHTVYSYKLRLWFERQSSRRRHSTSLVARATMTLNGSSHSGVLRQFDARRADDARTSAEVVRPNFRCVVEIANWCCRKDARWAGWLDGEGVDGRSTAGISASSSRSRAFEGGDVARGADARWTRRRRADLSLCAGDAEGDGCDIARANPMRSSSMD